MTKVTPDPPETENVSPYQSLDSKKLHQAAHRALATLKYAAELPPVAAAEPREAAFEPGSRSTEVLAHPAYAVCLTERVAWFNDRFAAERSLAGSAAATGKVQICNY